MKQLTPRSLVQLAVSAGDTTPVLPQTQSWIWSTVLGKPLYWSGTSYLDLTPVVDLALVNGPTLPVTSPTDPQVALKINGATHNKIMMTPLTSVGGVNLGLLVTAVQ